MADAPLADEKAVVVLNEPSSSAAPKSPCPSRTPAQGSAQDTASEVGDLYLKGARFWIMAVIIAVMLFIVAIDTTITTTSIIAITKDLGSFRSASWVLSAYQLGWVATIVISSKLSDIYGRKSVFLTSMVVFIIFSAGCAAAQTLPQLIIMRAFQGLGGGGCVALTTILITEAVPPEQLGTFASKMNVSLVFALVLGPVLGGAISSNTTWRWIFIINIPICGAAFALAIFMMPNGLRQNPSAGGISEPKPRSRIGLERIDVVGSILILTAAILFTACFQEADSRFAWDSAYVITLLTLSTVIGIALLAWERHISLRKDSREPVLPWWFLTDRIRAGVMLNFTLVGVPLVVTNFQLPQRFQLVNHLSSVQAGVGILPFAAAFTVGSFVCTQLSVRLRVPSIYLMFVGAALQTIGMALLSTLPYSLTFQTAIYGYQVVAGFGVGINYMALYLLIPFTSDKRDRAIAMGLSAQLRTMGSAFGLAIATSVFNGYVKPRLASLGLPADITSVSLNTLPLEVSVMVGRILSQAYNRQMLVLCGFAAAQMPAALLLWKREQIVTA